MTTQPSTQAPAVRLARAGLRVGTRRLWSDVDLEVPAGEFLAVVGANGSGKTSLLQVLLGLRPLTQGTVQVLGGRPRRGSHDIGYVPQQRRGDPYLPVRSRDLIAAGLTGHRWGIGWPSPERRRRIDQALTAADATHLAEVPVGLLSGGEHQRIRIAQALVGEPDLLLCDEPLLSLDPGSQSMVTALIDRRHREHGTTVIFVTHEINPVLPHADRVLYLGAGRGVVGTVDKVLTSQTLSRLYSAPVEVIRAGGRILVAGVPAQAEPVHNPDPATDESVRP